MDFTVKSYKKLLNALLSQGFSFITFAEYSAERNENASVANRIVNPQSAIRNPQSEISPPPSRCGCQAPKLPSLRPFTG